MPHHPSQRQMALQHAMLGIQHDPLYPWELQQPSIFKMDDVVGLHSTLLYKTYTIEDLTQIEMMLVERNLDWQTPFCAYRKPGKCRAMLSIDKLVLPANLSYGLYYPDPTDQKLIWA